MTQGNIAQQILSPAQRLNNVKAILTHQYSSLERIAEKENDEILLACKIIIIARDYYRFSNGKMDAKEMEPKQVFIELNKSRGLKYDEKILDILIAKPELIKDNITEKGLSTLQLLPGMMLKNSLFSTTHLLILAEGHEFTEHSIDKLIEYEQNQKHHFTVVVEQSSL